MNTEKEINKRAQSTEVEREKADAQAIVCTYAKKIAEF